MGKDREFNPNPKTPLDYWDENIDPAQMSGDHWVQEENAPIENNGFADPTECEVVEEKMTPPGAMFMHPSINVSYGNDGLTGTRPKTEKKTGKDANKSEK
ncbi:DUF3905 domain-containing protein [Alkalihalobacterium chitinilyticum]|uniref:DUF3905 domain-containing protein n=1 Tax=Alkalihalobacterium chitinilyticum TaxID=2980103 RepID=A0ABT5VCB2_9BACI|nr:DUF3905 domain-containing protein [Alkalihalobacterium chitinilyticum]MDE5412982.1 DUF3905 domain-containing protein [Alkalihalobacterium chitinilyticum]